MNDEPGEGATEKVELQVDVPEALRKLAADVESGTIESVALLAFDRTGRRQEMFALPKPPDQPGIVPEQARDRLLFMSKQLHAFGDGVANVAARIVVPDAKGSN